MALLFMESFDHLATADVTEKWTSFAAYGGTGDASSVGAFGRRSTNGLKLGTGAVASNTSVGLYRTFSPSDNTLIVGLAFNPMSALASLDTGTDPNGVGAVGTGCLVLVRNAGADQCWVRVNTNGTVSVYRTSTLLGTTSAALTAGTFTYIEILLTIHNTAGVVTVRFNGVDVLGPLTSQNTRAGALNAWNELRFGGVSNSTATAVDWRFDDLYIADGTGAAPWNAFLGDCRVDVRTPTAEGAASAWTPSTGTDNALTVDETPPNDDTDYNSTTTIGATDTFVTQDAPVVGATIYGVQHCLNMKKSDSGTCTVSPVIRHSGTDYAGAALAPGTGYAYGLQIAQTNPGTAAQWTEAEFNAAQFGYKRIS